MSKNEIFVRPEFTNGELRGFDVETGTEMTDKIRPVQLRLALQSKQYVRYTVSTGKQRRFAMDKIDAQLSKAAPAVVAEAPELVEA